MKVVELLEIKEVPDNWLNCTICGKYHPRESYHVNNIQVRTNCNNCYELNYDDFNILAIETANLYKTIEYKTLVKQLNEELLFLNNSYTPDELIELLKILPKNARVVITETGYYSQSPLADLYPPEKYKTINNIDYYSIGHSEQGY